MHPNQTKLMSARRGRLAVGLALASLVVPVAAGCGGGGKEKGGGGKGGGTQSTKTHAKTPTGGVVKGFTAKVSSSTSATLTVVLSKPGSVAVTVRKVAANNPTRVGKVSLGRRPAGRSTYTWNLKVKGRKLTPGRYELVARVKGVGKSKPVNITVPGG